MKTCRTCLQLGEFGPDKRSPDGLQSQCRNCRRQYQREYNSVANKLPEVIDYKRYRHLVQKYWKDKTNTQVKDEYNKLFVAQNGRCGICETHQDDLKRPMHVDHDHSNGKIRGLLCSLCNQGIGLLKEDISRLDAAKEYLLKHKPNVDEATA